MIQCCRPFWLSQVLFPDPPVDPPEPGLCYHYFLLNDPLEIGFSNWTVNGGDFLTFWSTYNTEGETKKANADAGGNNFWIWTQLPEGDTPPDYTILDFFGNPVAFEWIQAGCSDDTLCMTVAWEGIDDLDNSGVVAVSIFGFDFIIQLGDPPTGQFGDPLFMDILLDTGSPGQTTLTQYFGDQLTGSIDISGTTVTLTIGGFYLLPTSFTAEIDGSPEVSNITEIPCP